VNKSFTRKKVLKTNLKDAQTAEGHVKHKETIEAITAAETDGKLKESNSSPFLFS
jgi:hypothetical protein